MKPLIQKWFHLNSNQKRGVMYKLISVLSTMLFLSIFQVELSYAQCCKCFNSPTNCSTECTHSSGHDWCGCDGGCSCGETCGSSGGGGTEPIREGSHLFENILNFNENLASQNTNYEGLIEFVGGENLLNSLSQGYIDGLLFEDSSVQLRQF